MYGREYGDKTLHFEPSGGLLHAALVMQDKETDTYWSIMTGDALAGSLEGTPLRELPLGEKARFGDWKEDHPDTLVLSVDGEEHVRNSPYDNYFASDEAPMGARLKDRRLPAKEPIYAFQRDGTPFAVPNAVVEGGAIFTLGDEEIFLYRPPGAPLFASSSGWVGDFETVEGEDGQGTVRHVPTGATFDAEAESFTGGEGSVPRLDGFDTFWFHWSRTHPKTKLVQAP